MAVVPAASASAFPAQFLATAALSLCEEWDESSRRLGQGCGRRPIQAPLQDQLGFSGFLVFPAQGSSAREDFGAGACSIWLFHQLRTGGNTLSRHHVTNLNLHSLFFPPLFPTQITVLLAKDCAFRRIGFAGVLAETSAADVADADWFALWAQSDRPAWPSHRRHPEHSHTHRVQTAGGCGKPLRNVWVECILSISVYLHLNFGERERDFMRQSFCTSPRSHQYGYRYVESRRVCLYRTGAASSQPAGYHFPGVNSVSHIALSNLQSMISGLVN